MTSFIYMLFCNEEDKVFVKIGVSDRPTKRLSALASSAPLRPKLFAFMEIWDRSSALVIESRLHEALAKWHSHGEWFVLSYDERDNFKTAWKNVLFGFHRSGWPLVWNQVSVDAVLRVGRKTQAYVRRQYARRGRAFRDFAMHGGLTHRS